MKERPILFQGEMVRALLELRKRQTRRVINPQPKFTQIIQGFAAVSSDERNWTSCPYGDPGDRLWVRETHQIGYDINSDSCMVFKADGNGFQILADQNGEGDCVGLGKQVAYHPIVRWKPSIFMPRWGSRITLEIEEVHVERVQDISEEDAKAEGADIMREYATDHWQICSPRLGRYREGYRWLWNKINTKRGFGWESNPRVWVLKFGRIWINGDEKTFAI